MTMNTRDAAYHTVHDYPGGCASLAPRMGKSPTTLAHEVSGQGAAKFGLLDAAKLMDMTGDLRILMAMATSAGQMLVPLPTVDVRSSDDCMQRLAGTVQEFGDLCREVAVDLADGTISDNELARIDKECGQLIASVHALRESLAHRNQACKVHTATVRI